MTTPKNENEFVPLFLNPTYLINRLGEVKDLRKNQLLTPYLHKKDKEARVHFLGVAYSLRRLVAKQFMKEFSDNCIVQLIDSNPFNCQLSNLRIIERKKRGPKVEDVRSSAFNEGYAKAYEDIIGKISDLENFEDVYSLIMK